MITVCFARAAVTEFYKLSDLNNRNVLSHGSGRLKSKIKVSAGLVHSLGFEEESLSCLFPSFW